MCRGCKRFDYEVINWNAYSQPQKRAIDTRLSQLLSQVVERRFLISNDAVLYKMLKLQQVRYRTYRDGYCALYELLKAGASQIEDSSAYGFRVRWGYQEMTLSQLRLDIERENYSLSVAHLERYVLANKSRANCVSEEIEA